MKIVYYARTFGFGKRRNMLRTKAKFLERNQVYISQNDLQKSYRKKRSSYIYKRGRFEVFHRTSM